MCKMNWEKKVQLVSNLMVIHCRESQQSGNAPIIVVGIDYEKEFINILVLYKFY